MRVRVNSDGAYVSPGLNTDPHCASLYVSDGTGVALTTPTSATTIGGSPMAVGESFGLTAAAAGTITAVRQGRYDVSFHLSEITPVNSQVITIEVYKNGSALTYPIIAKFTQPGTAVAIPGMTGRGLVTLTTGDILTLKATADTGNFTVKRLQFNVIQLADLVQSVTT